LKKYAEFSTTIYSQAFGMVAARNGGEINRLNWSQRFLDEIQAYVMGEIARYKSAPLFLNETLPVVFTRPSPRKEGKN
jgi:hypothetical protein